MLHKVSFWIVTLTITFNYSKQTWFITSVAGQGTEKIPVSTENLHVYCTVEADCKNLNTDTTNSDSLQSVFNLKWSSWCPPEYHLDEDLMRCSQKSCLHVSQKTIELLQGTGQSLSTLIKEDNNTNKNLVCVPITSEYKKCPKLPLTPRQYEVLENNASIRILEANVSVPMGEFVIFESGIASVCIPISNKISNMTLTLEENKWQSLNKMSPACMPFKVPSEQIEIESNGTAYAFNYSISFENHFYDKNSSTWENLTSVCHELSTDFVNCPNMALGLREEFVVLPNLSIQEAYRQKKILDLGSYLFTKQEEIVVYCFPAVAPKGYSATKRYLYGTACIISTLFSFTALLAHILFPSLNYHAKPLLCHIISIIIQSFLMAIRFFENLNEWDVLPCRVFFDLNYIAVLGTFFWPNILAIDLWRVFSNLHGRSRASKEHKRRKFLYQCAYGWGLPILLCIIIMTVDTNKRLQRILNLPLDITNGSSCWFSTYETRWIFFRGPIMCILVLNTFFFVTTVYNIRNASKGTDMVNKKVSRQLFRVFVKLFIVTGITWLAEVVPWFAKLDERWYYFTDTTNCLQGVAIFVVYVCKRRTLKLIRRKLGYEDTRPGSQVTLSVSNSLQGSTVKATDEMQYAEPKPGQHMEMTTDDAFENGNHD